MAKEVRVPGATVFWAADLLAPTGCFTPGTELTPADLQGVRRGSSPQHGDFLAQAYARAHEIKDNVVTITVSEGRYGTVALRNAYPEGEALCR